MRCRGLGPPHALTLHTFLGQDTPVVWWHCTHFWDKIPLHALTLHTFWGQDTPSPTDIAHIFFFLEVPLHALTLHTFWGQDTPSPTDIAHIFWGEVPLHALTLHTFWGQDTPSPTDIAHIFCCWNYPFMHWHCTHFRDEILLNALHCTHFGDEMPICALTLHPFLGDEVPLCLLTLHTFWGWDAHLCTDIAHIYGVMKCPFVYWNCTHFGDEMPICALTLHTFWGAEVPLCLLKLHTFWGWDAHLCTDIAPIFGVMKCPFVYWNCTHFGGWNTPSFADIVHSVGKRYPFVCWHCTRFGDEIPFHALMLNTFFGTRCRGLGRPHALTFTHLTSPRSRIAVGFAGVVAFPSRILWGSPRKCNCTLAAGFPRLRWLQTWPFFFSFFFKFPLPHVQPHAVFGRFVAVSGQWTPLCKAGNCFFTPLCKEGNRFFYTQSTVMIISG